MRHHHRLAAALLGACLIASFNASADDAAGRNLADIRAQQTELLADVRAGEGDFEEMAGPEREELAARQVRLLAMIEGKDTVADLDDDAQVEAFNLLEQINATINDVQGQRVVCERVLKTGSHRKVKVCMTVAERDQLREDSRTVIEKAKNGLGFSNGGARGFGND